MNIESVVASRVIQSLYGHNKYSNYNEIDDEEQCMEAGFDEIEKEDLVSRIIGEKEDEYQQKLAILKGEKLNT